MSEQEIQEIRISELPEAAPLQGDELLEMVQGGENVKVRADQMGGGVEEAPEDGKQYARKDGAWAEVVASGGGGGDESTVTLNFEGVDPADDGQWVPLYTDFPDNTKTYKGTINVKDAYGNTLPYTASYNPNYMGWLVGITIPSNTGEIPFAYITSSMINNMVIAAPVSLYIDSGLSDGLSSIEVTGAIDIRAAMGVPTPMIMPEISLSISAGHANDLLETPLYGIGDLPFEFIWVVGTFVDKLGEGALENFPADMRTLLNYTEKNSFGFTRGPKYWEVNTESGETSDPEYDPEALKITVMSESDEQHTISFPMKLVME